MMRTRDHSGEGQRWRIGAVPLLVLGAFVLAACASTTRPAPVVDRAERIYDMIVREPNQSTSAVMDGRVLTSLTEKHRVRVQQAEQTFKLVEVSGQGYYRTLREKLGWAGEFNKNIDKKSNP